MSLKGRKPTFFRVSTKLTLAYSLVLVLSCLVVFGLLYYQIAQTLRNQEQRVLLANLEELSSRVEVQGVQDLDQYLTQKSQGILVYILSNNGEIRFIHESPNLPSIDFNRQYESLFTQEGPIQAFQLPEELVPDNLMAVGKRLQTGDILLIAKGTQAIHSSLASIRNIFLWLFLPVIGIGFLGGLVLSNSTLTPIRELVISMRKIESGSLSTRVPTSQSGDELEELKVLCNRMLDKIEGLVNSLKEAFDHLAHDIRTPVTRLRGRAELALSSDESDTETYREALQSCYENSDKILNFLQVLTDITEAENRSKKLKLEKRYVSDLVKEMLSLYEMAFEEKDIQLDAKLDTQDWAMVDARLISRVIANLLDNAHKYTASGGRVTIETLNQTENVVLRVTDTGPGISPEEHAMIWQKLYRSDKSRSEYGMGLGLTFVKAVVEAHDGKVYVHSPVDNGRGTRFEVVLQKMS